MVVPFKLTSRGVSGIALPTPGEDAPSVAGANI
jgi:hypothetical protein